MSRKDALRSYPGQIIDLFFWRREYDMMLHGVTFKEKGGE